LKGGKMKEKNLVEKVEEIYENLNSPNKKDRKKAMKIMRKAKVSRSKLKKGYIGVIKIEENGNASGEKSKIENFVYKLKKGDYHVSDGGEKLWWNGKHPFLIQPTWKLSPLDLRKKPEEKNETQGQKLVLATMKKDLITKKGTGNSIIWIVLLIVAAVIGYSLIKGGA